MCNNFLHAIKVIQTDHFSRNHTERHVVVTTGWLHFVVLMSLLSTNHSLLYKIVYNCSLANTFCGGSKNYSSVPNFLITNQTQIVLLANNMISKVQKEDFANSSMIYFLNLNFNLLTSVPYLPSLNASLQNLVLKNNKISSIDPQNLVILTSLITLQLDNNFLTFLPDFELPNLQALILTNNLFTELPYIPLLGKSLFYINLNNNQINIVSSKALNSYKNASYLAIDSNNITTLPNMCTSFATPTQPTKLLVDKNQLNCDCRLLWLRANPNTFEHNAVCSNPPNLAGIPVNSTNIFQFKCGGKFRQNVILSVNIS